MLLIASLSAGGKGRRVLRMLRAGEEGRRDCGITSLERRKKFPRASYKVTAGFGGKKEGESFFLHGGENHVKAFPRPRKGKFCLDREGKGKEENRTESSSVRPRGGEGLSFARSFPRGDEKKAPICQMLRANPGGKAEKAFSFAA